MLKKTFFIFSSFLALTVLSSFITEKKQKALKTVIVDAGHGVMPNGGYNGAKGNYSYEDDICLAVAQKLAAQLAREMPEVKVVQTRTTKYIVDLHERADIANQNRGDLFISIHVNAMPPIEKRQFLGYKTRVTYVGKGKKRRKVTKKVPQYRYYSVPNTARKGTETYIWGSHKNDDKEVALRENAPMFSEENYKEKYGDIDPNSPDFIALSLLKTKQFFKRSATLAGMIETEFAKVGRTSLGQQQRAVGIWVLQATAMPSVLVETGFITNPDEEDYLNSERGQDEIADCVTKAVKTYTAWLEKQQNVGGQVKTVAPTTEKTYAFLKNVEDQEQHHKAPKK